MRCHATSVALLAVLAMLLTACGGASSGPAEPGAALDDAVERTVGDSFAFSVRVEMDEAATATVADTEPLLATVLPNLEVHGMRTTAGFAFEVQVSGQPLVEWRQPEEDRLYARVQAAAIADMFDVSLERTQVLESLTVGAPGAAGFYDTAIDGGWVGVRGPAEEYTPPGGADYPDFDSEEIRAAKRQHLGGSLTEALRRFTTVTDAPGGEGRRLDVALRTRAAAEAAAEVQRAVFAAMQDEAGMEAGMEMGAGMTHGVGAVPTAVSGITIDLRDRRVQRVTVEIFELARQLATGGDGPEGSLTLVAELSEHGSASVAVPDDATMVDAAELGLADPRRLLPFGVGMPPSVVLLSYLSTATGTMVESEAELEATVPEAPAATATATATAVPVPPGEVDVAEPSPSS